MAKRRNTDSISLNAQWHKKRDLVLKPYQAEVIEDILNKNIAKRILAMDTGTGKTIVGLTLLRVLEPKRALVITKSILIHNAWLLDNARFTQFCMPITPLVKSNLNLIKEPGLFITSFDMYRLMADDLRSVTWDIVIIDESHRIGNRGAQVTKKVIGTMTVRGIVNELKADRMYLMTGSLAPNREEQVYSQMRAVGLRETWGHFADRFFCHPVPMMPYIIKFKEHMREEYNALVARYTTVVKKADTELSDIAKNWKIITFDSGRYPMTVQEAIRKHGLYRDGKISVTCDFSVTEVMRFRQLARGFVTTDDGQVVYLDPGPIELLTDLLDDTLDGKPVVVWYSFNAERDAIVTKLKREMSKRKVLVLQGGMTHAAQTQMIAEFDQSKDAVLLVQFSVGKNGLTLVNCNNMVFFSLEDNAESFHQAQDRIHRIGQTEDCNYYVFQGVDTIDEAIWNSLQRKTNMVEDLKKWIQENRE